MPEYKDFIGLGIAGNFALHLSQAGELEEFKDIITADESAPKGLFPFYLPAYSKDKTNLKAQKTLSTYPLSCDTIQLPKQAVKVQAEPEVGLICTLEYTEGKLSNIIPTHFAAYNDCSIRVAGAAKISDKKNWGEKSKGFSSSLIKIDKFAEGGIMDNYSICSFLKRNNEMTPYGENVALNGYSYFYNQLTHWMLNQIRTQGDVGPLEPLNSYIQACNNPQKAIISIGATRYTAYGETTFLQPGDEILIALYDRNHYSFAQVTECLQTQQYKHSNMSVLAQHVIE